MQTITITKKAALGIAAAFAGLFVLGVAGGAWASHSFSDVPDDHTFHDSIGYVASAGIANGFADGTYRPSQDVTRGQMAAFIHRASGNAPGIAPSVNASKLAGENGDQLLDRISDLEAEVDTLTGKVSNLEHTLQFVSIVDANTMRITGANLQIVSGSGTTGGPVNGTGNLILGYNEGSVDARTGSHNLVIGPFHSYSSYGGIVAGYDHTISGALSSVTGGVANVASGDFASVTGGLVNTADGDYSTVSGGWQRSVNGDHDWRAGAEYFQDS